MGKMGLRINQKRKENHLTMQELADKLGVQASAVNKWEKGIVENIKRETIQQMAELFGCSPVWLMGYDEPPKEEMLNKETAILLAQITKSYELKEYVNKLMSLSDEQRKAIFNMIDFYVTQNQTIPVLEPSQNQEQN